MRILITGGAGFIGSHVADACLAAKHEVLIVDDLSSGRRENVPSGAKLVEVDIRDAEALEDVVSTFKPDAVSHQAAQVSVSVSTREPQRDARTNVEGSLNLLESCVRAGVAHLVFASTGGAIYGEIPEPERGAVGRTPVPLSPYACSKLSVEAYLNYYRHQHGLKSTILRYANVYGPRQDPHGEAGVVAIFTQRLLAGQGIQVNARKEPGDPGCVRDYVMVDDVVRANVLALSGEIGETVVNVGTGVATTTLDLAREIETALGVKADLKFGPKRSGDVERSVLEPWQGLGATVPLAEGIRRTASWFAQRR
ncbi:NAD-dependent epimerase/dehydratase family protein [Sandaracinus amylolyticus]|uniref:UDP-glucose 4-epimerase n=1 Tax=Sandaracinus amylolyticus TaxID=927083 RepID=A0A0F6YLP9_9BACT|nr:NAD-dependent epimerase/dehydratase family protein [Sandaracinus amylolyticus]AKF09432.1 UDP-glucose 4-epimerase [Sandaracinus amylolyticus]